METRSDSSNVKSGLHPRNLHKTFYDFKKLTSVCPELATFVRLNKYNIESVDFTNPNAVKTLNKALLKLHYNIAVWDIPENYLCPSIPGRADYIHYVADLLAAGHKGQVPKGKSVTVLDIGVGANCVYPIIGHISYGWQFVGSDTDQVAIRCAKQIVESNPVLIGNIDLRLQTEPSNIFSNVLKTGEIYDLSICNPPFHASPEKALEAAKRKTQNLSGELHQKPTLNFGGQFSELCYDGGESEFLRRMVKQSSEIPFHIKWFTSLVSRKENLRDIYKSLKKLGAKQVRTIEMSQGHKQSRIVAWTFHTL